MIFPVVQESTSIKIQTMRGKLNIYKNNRHLLLPWWECQPYFNDVSIWQDNKEISKISYGNDYSYE